MKESEPKSRILYVCGIDTEVGKSYGTAYMISYLRSKGLLACTSMKLVQTGCKEISDDIRTHRRLVGEDLTEWDKAGWTCPYLFSYPSSPHLAARMERKKIDPEVLSSATSRLLKNGANPLLVECAGGLMVPLCDELLTIDYIASQPDPKIMLVTSGRLGSINHTLLSIEACMHRGIRVEYLLYNEYPTQDPLIEDETKSYLEHWCTIHLPDTSFLHMPVLIEE